MNRLRFAMRLPTTGVLCLALIGGQAGCVSSKYTSMPATAGVPHRLAHDLGGSPVNGRLDSVIVHQGQGSWKKAAYWDELIVTLRNDSAQPVTLTAASIVDFAGQASSAGADPWQLEKESRAREKSYAKAGVDFAMNTLFYSAVAAGGVSTGMVIGAAATSTWGGLAAGAAAGLVAVPLAVGVVYYTNQKHKRAIEQEFSRRRLAFPVTLLPGQEVSGSLFFPFAVSPRELHLTGKAGDSALTAVYTLHPHLEGLHRKAAPRPRK